MPLPKPPSLRCVRSFTTALRTPTPTTQFHPAPRYTKRPPPYPYGPAQHYKQSDSGLYGGATIQFGNKVSEKNALKSRRAWRPNIHHKRLWSDALGRFVPVKVQARVLRTIDKCGGLDEYLLGEKTGRIKELGVEGWRLRWMVMGSGKVGRRFKEERVALGLGGWEDTTTMTTGGTGRTIKKRTAKRAEAATLEQEVERASESVLEQLSGANAALSETHHEPEHKTTDRSIALPPSALETRINHTTHALEAFAKRSHALPSTPTNPEPTPTQPPSRRYTKSEKRAWRAQHPPSPSLTPTLTSMLQIEELAAEIAQIETLAAAEMAEMAEMEEGEGERRARLEAGMARMRGARAEMERVRGREEGGVEKGMGMGTGEGEGKRLGMGEGIGAEGGMLGRLTRLFIGRR